VDVGRKVEPVGDGSDHCLQMIRLARIRNDVLGIILLHASVFVRHIGYWLAVYSIPSPDGNQSMAVAKSYGVATGIIGQVGIGYLGIIRTCRSASPRHLLLRRCYKTWRKHTRPAEAVLAMLRTSGLPPHLQAFKCGAGPEQNDRKPTTYAGTNHGSRVAVFNKLSERHAACNPSILGTRRYRD